LRFAFVYGPTSGWGVVLLGSASGRGTALQDVRLCVRFPMALFVCLLLARQPPVGHGHLIDEVFLDHTQRRTTVDRTPLDE